MAVKDIKLGREAQTLVLKGVNILANTVKATLGPRGRNVLIEKTFGAPVVTKDGVTVAKAVESVVEEIRKLSKGVKGRKEIASVATVSANGDETIGNILAGAMEKVGKDGVITVEEGKGLEA